MSFIDDLLAEATGGSKEPARAALRVQVTESLLRYMEERGIRRSDLAARLGVSKSAVSQLLVGSRNMSLNTLADVAAALDLVVDVALISSVKSEGSTRPDFVEELAIDLGSQTVVSAYVDPAHRTASADYWLSMDLSQSGGVQ